VRRRSVNNHNNIKLLTTQVGAVLSQENLKTPAARDCAPATAVIVQVDGGHIPLKQQDKRSFEALLALSTAQKASAGLTNIIVRLIARALPYQLKMITCHDENVSTQCGAEAGMKPVVTALADGACNCWSVILSLTLTANNCSASWIGFTSLRSFRMLGCC